MITLQDCIAMCDRRARAHPAKFQPLRSPNISCPRARRRDEDMLGDDIRAALRRHDRDHAPEALSMACGISAQLEPASAPGSTHHADHRNINLVGFLLLLVGQHRVEVLERRLDQLDLLYPHAHELLLGFDTFGKCL